MHAIDAHSALNSREGVLVFLLDAGAAVDVWGHDLRGPLDLLAAREAQQAQQQSEMHHKAQLQQAGAPPLRAAATRAAPPSDLASLIRCRSSGHELVDGVAPGGLSPM